MKTRLVTKVDLRDRFREQIEDFTVLKEIVADARAARGLLGWIKQRTAADDGSIWLLDVAEECLEVVVGRDDFVGFRQPTARGLVSMVVWSEHAIAISDVAQHERFDDTADRALRYQTKTIVVQPLVVRGRLIGVVSAVNKQGAASFDGDDQQTMALGASLLGTAIESTLLARLVSY